MRSEEAEGAEGLGVRALGQVEEAHARSRAALLLALPLVATSMIAFELLDRPIHVPPAMLVGFGAAAALGWAAFFFRTRPWLSVIVVAVALASLHAVLSLIQLQQPPPIEPIVMAVLVWSGLLIRPTWNVLLALYFVVDAWLSGVPLHVSGVIDESAISVPELTVFSAAALAIGAVFHAHNKDVETRLRRVVAVLRRQQDDLEASLRRKAQELEYSLDQLLEAQKLEGVRTIVAGLAHELNNILTPIRGLAELLTEGGYNEQTRRYGQRILQSAIAAASITEALMTYSRQGSFHPVRTELSRLLEDEILPSIRQRLPDSIELESKIEGGMYADVDRALLQRCIRNLVTNALDAMPNGGKLCIRLTPAPGEEGTTLLTPTHCLLSVRDSGSGVRPEHLDRIFDPFFTTKAVGAGRGLGLAMVQGTVTRHGGRVRVESTETRGSTFVLELPLVEYEGPKNASVENPMAEVNAHPTVLVLAADQDVVDELEEILLELQCMPRCTRSVEEAERLVRETNVRLLLVSDEMIRPGSYALFKAAKESDRDIPIIITVADPSSPAVHSVDFLGPIQCLRSPMEASILTEVVSSVLRETPADPLVENSRMVEDAWPVRMT